VALAPGALPVRSLNGEACAVAEDIVQVRRTSLGSASSSEFVRRTFRDAPFELGSSLSATTILPASAVAASSAAPPPLSVAVERDAVQQQLSASISGPGSVRRLLVPGGSTVEANEASTLERLARLLVGVVEGDSQLRARRVLHLGFAMTAAGRLEMRGGKLVLCAHPQLGFWLLPRHVVARVGLHDERIFYTPEDVDYCLRIWAAGYEVVQDGDAVAIHDAREIARGGRRPGFAFSHARGLGYLFVKHRYALGRARLYRRLKIARPA
jgi:hypothetical protein